MPQLPDSDLRRRGPRDNRHRDACIRLKDERESGARAIRSSARWNRVRHLVRARQPICADPFGGHAREGVVVASAEIHHIVPVRERPDLAFTPSNLQALCCACHERVERE